MVKSAKRRSGAAPTATNDEVDLFEHAGRFAGDALAVGGTGDVASDGGASAGRGDHLGEAVGSPRRDDDLGSAIDGTESEGAADAG